MLGQYAQVMAIRAAQQEMEGSEGVKSAIAGGMDPTDPRMLQYGPRGVAAFKAAGEGRSKQLEAAEKQLTMTGQIAGYVRDNPTPENFMSAVGTMVQSGVLTRAQAERVIADAGNDPTKIKLYAERAASDAIKEADKLSAQTTRRGQDISAGTTIRGQNLTEARERDRMARELQQGTLVPLDDGYGRVDKFGNINRVQGYGNYYGPNAAAPAPAMPPAAANAFVATQPSSVNALAPTAPSQVVPGSPTVANALAIEQQQNIPRPKQPFRAPVPVMIDNRAVLVPADKAIGMQPATAFTEKQAAGKVETVRSLNTAIANLTDAIKPGGLLEKSTGSGFGRMVDASAAFVGKATEGAKAAASLAPIADLVLKMVPRFEGPQSDKDTQSYKEAAGQLADSSLPNETRKDAAKVILRLMKERKDQFGMSDQVGGSSGGAPADQLGIR
jgi:hypothetical protein